ncbi:hypothetical protein OG587_13260 [Streptosporangium sp. NBC_01469]|nr:hypothetical protein [Streptosporangium sp. NBC_01469]
MHHLDRLQHSPGSPTGLIEVFLPDAIGIHACIAQRSRPQNLASHLFDLLPDDMLIWRFRQGLHTVKGFACYRQGLTLRILLGGLQHRRYSLAKGYMVLSHRPRIEPDLRNAAAPLAGGPDQAVGTDALPGDRIDPRLDLLEPTHRFLSPLQVGTQMLTTVGS